MVKTSASGWLFGSYIPYYKLISSPVSLFSPHIKPISSQSGWLKKPDHWSASSTTRTRTHETSGMPPSVTTHPHSLPQLNPPFSFWQFCFFVFSSNALYSSSGWISSLGNSTLRSSSRSTITACLSGNTPTTLPSPLGVSTRLLRSGRCFRAAMYCSYS